MNKLILILNELKPEIDFINANDLVERRILDSLDIVLLVTDFEDAFNIKISADDIIPENFKDLAAMMSLIERLGGQI